MFSIEKPSSSRQKEKAPMERLTPLQEKESENASLRQRFDQLQRAITELEAENENLRAEKANREARIAALKAKDQIIQSLSNALNRREAEVDYYKQFTVKMENLSDELSNQLEVINARREIHKDTGPVPSAASEKANSHWFLHTGELEKFRERPKIAEVLNIGLAERHVVTPSAPANSSSNPPYPLRTPLSMASRLEGETTILPRSSTPRLPTPLASSWNFHRSENVVSPAYSRTDEPVKTHSRVAAEPPRDWVGSSDEEEEQSDEEEEQKPDTSVQTDYEEATSQTRGKYWPRGVL